MGDCILRTGVFSALALLALLVLPTATANEELRCALILAHFDEPYDLDDASLLALADVYEETDRGRMADLIRVNLRIEKIRREVGPDAPELLALYTQRQGLRTHIEVPRRLVGSPFVNVPDVLGVRPSRNVPDYFRRINPPKKSVILGGDGRDRDSPKRRVLITKPFDMSDLITQGMWARVFSRNPSGNTSNALFRVNHYPVDPHRPVENITFWSAMVFANRVSDLEGLTPAYDLSGITWAGIPPGDNLAMVRAAAAGTLQASSGTYSVRPNRGYRLPSEAQWEYAARGGENNPHFRAKYPFGDVSALKDYAWYWDSSRTIVPENFSREHAPSTQRVAAKRSSLLGLHDMLGNVEEWVEDGWSTTPPGSESAAIFFPPADPVTIDTSLERTVRGGYFADRAVNVGADSRRPDGYRRSEYRGFRLVRPVN